MDPKEKRKALKYLAYVSQIGISMLTPILVGIFIGKFLDNLIGTRMLFLAIFTIMGVAAAFLNLFKMTTRDIDRK